MMTTRSTIENRDKDCARIMDDNEEHTAKQPNVSTCCLSVRHLSYSLNLFSLILLLRCCLYTSELQIFLANSANKALRKQFRERWQKLICVLQCFWRSTPSDLLGRGMKTIQWEMFASHRWEEKERYIASNWRLREEWLMSQKMRWEISDSKMLSWKDSLSQCARSAAVWEFHWRSSRRLRFRCKW